MVIFSYLLTVKIRGNQDTRQSYRRSPTILIYCAEDLGRDLSRRIYRDAQLIRQTRVTGMIDL